MCVVCVAESAAISTAATAVVPIARAWVYKRVPLKLPPTWLIALLVVGAAYLLLERFGG